MTQAKSPARKPTSSTSSPGSEKLPPAEPGLAEFLQFASRLKIEDGSPLEIYSEQGEMLTPYFSGTKETVILVPKGNGKSTLIAAVALHHLLITPFANCLIVAASRDQAEIILRQVVMFIRQAPALRSRMRVLRREVESLIDGGKIEVKASDVDTLDGAMPTLAIVDELHRHRTGDVREVLRLGLGKRDGRMLVISTAGARMDSPLGLIRKKAYAMKEFVRDQERRRSFALSASGAFAFIEWCLDPEDDPNDLDLVKRVNPAPWRTKQVLADEKDSVTPWQWLRLVCNVWTEGEEPWLEPAKWDSLADPTMQVAPGAAVWLGVSIGVKQERTDIILLERDGDRVRVGLQSVLPMGAEDRVPIDSSQAAVRRTCGSYNVWGVVYISKGFQWAAEKLEEEGYPIVEMPQTPLRLELASQTLFSLIEEMRLVHDGNADLRASVLAGVIKTTESGWRLRSDPRCAALLALAAVAQIALSEEQGDPQIGWLGDEAPEVQGPNAEDDEDLFPFPDP